MASTSCRITSLADLDGLSIKDTKRMPHPVDLGRWSDAGWYEIDLVRDMFRLTAVGKAKAADAA